MTYQEQYGRTRENSIGAPKQQPQKVTLSRSKLERIKENQFVKGFFTGILTTVIVAGLAVGFVKAADKEAQIQDQQMRAYYEDMGIDFDTMVQEHLDRANGIESESRGRTP